MNATSAPQDPLEELLELLVTHRSPAEQMPVLGGLMAILLRDVQMSLLDEELSRAGETAGSRTVITSPP
jgi:hypothetical protein